MRVLLLFALSCGGGFDGEGDPGPSPWASGDLACYSSDGCPSLRCTCLDASVTQVRGCIGGACIDDPERFCTDFCLSRGGHDRQTAVHLYACLDVPDRDACLSCRDEAARECNDDPCAGPLDAMMGCLAATAPTDLPEGVEDYGWDEVGGGVCYPERVAHRNCIFDDCAAFDACEEWRDYHPPIAR